ncbi:MAG: CinA family protein [Dehalococcoidia bacterium]
MSFLDAEQQALAADIAERVIARGETVAVAESTTGGLIAAALLSVAGASRYFAGGGVVYTLKSRTALAGADPAQYANYRGTTTEMLESLAESMRDRLGATWCIAESGLAGPTGGRTGAAAGRTTMSVVGPVTRTEKLETGSDDRVENMGAFTTASLRLLRNAIASASG